MAFILEGEVEVIRVDELLDGSPATVRTKKFLTDLLAEPKSSKYSFLVIESALIHDNISQKNIAGSGQTYGHVNDVQQEITGNKLFQNQAHGGDNIRTFSASTTFDADDGNNQAMIVTAATTIGITNELPGIYVFTLPIDSGAGPAITIGASFGDAANDNATLSDVDNDINVITLVVRPGGGKYYTITTITP